MSKTATKQVYTVLGEFGSPGDLLKAAEQTRGAGYKKFDCHSPFPIHGMDAAMGLKRSMVGYIAGICGLLGGAFAMWLQWWTSTIDYPLIISGKPLFSYQAYIIVTFGLAILGAAFGAVIGMLVVNRLPMWFHGNFYSTNFKRFSDDAFFVSIDADDPQFETDKAKSFLESIGATSVEIVEGA